MTFPRGKPGPKCTFTQAVFDAVCARIAQGETLVQICRDEGMPERGTIYNWMENHPERTAAMANARMLGFEVLAEGCLEIADDGRNDWMESKAGPVVNAEAIARSKLRVWTRLQMLARWDPKRYAEVKAIGGAAQLGPVRVTAVDLTDDELATIANGSG